LANVDKLMSNLQSGKGTMGKLLNDEALYANLSKTSKEVGIVTSRCSLEPNEIR